MGECKSVQIERGCRIEFSRTEDHQAPHWQGVGVCGRAVLNWEATPSGAEGGTVDLLDMAADDARNFPWVDVPGSVMLRLTGLAGADINFEVIVRARPWGRNVVFKPGAGRDSAVTLRVDSWHVVAMNNPPAITKTVGAKAGESGDGPWVSLSSAHRAAREVLEQAEALRKRAALLSRTDVNARIGNLRGRISVAWENSLTQYAIGAISAGQYESRRAALDDARKKVDALEKSMLASGVKPAHDLVAKALGDGFLKAVTKQPDFDPPLAHKHYGWWGETVESGSAPAPAPKPEAAKEVTHRDAAHTPRRFALDEDL